MMVNYNIKDRKPFVKALEEITGAKAKYLYTPSYAFEVGIFTVTREGNLTYAREHEDEFVEMITKSSAKKYKENNTSFDTVMSDITKLFGLMLPTDKNADKNPNLVLNEYEIAKLKTAYEKTMDGAKGSFKRGEDDYVMYGGYEPLSVTITHILNNKSGIDFSSYSHTGLPVAVFAKGAGQDLFSGYYDNTQVYYNIAEILDVE